MKNNLINKILISGLFISFSFSSFAQEWTVPEPEKEVVPTIKFDTKAKQDGKDIFNRNCKSCHGDIGKNNSIVLVPPPGDPASEKFAKNTDGELFYKITHGKGPMPKFKDRLSEIERWCAISYIRSFHPDYVPADGGEDIVDNSFKGTDLKMFVHLNQVNLEAIVEVHGQLDEKEVPANGVRVGFYVKRNFGLLPVCEPVTTNKEGVASAIFPNDLPGDSLGKYNIIIKLIDNDIYGDVVYKEKINWGKEFIYENPLNNRELWGTRDKAPLWLLALYFGMLAGALITIVWVLLQLKKLKSLGK